MSPNPNLNSSSDEDLLVEIFQEAVGFSGDVNCRPRYIDYAVESAAAKYAFDVGVLPPYARNLWGRFGPPELPGPSGLEGVPLE